MTGCAARWKRIPWRTGLNWPGLVLALFAGVAAAAAGSVAGAVFLRIFKGNLPTGYSFPEMLAQSACALIALCGVVMFWPPRGKFFAKLGIRPMKWADAGFAALTWFAVLLVGGGFTEIWQMLLDWTGIPYVEKQGLLISFAGSSAWEIVGMGIVVVVAVPAGEEIFFRRLLFGLFRPLGLWRGILLTSLVFAGVHFFLLGVPALFVMGVGFQLSYLHRRNLCVPMLAHGLVNLCALAGVFFQ